MTATGIEISGLRHAIRGTEILAPATLTIPAGQITALIGPNGAGKSTLSRLIARIEPPPAGTVAVNGEVLQEDYIAEPTYLGYDVTFPYTVPEGTVFVMGDNRNASLDSRSSYVGCIDERDILGKVLLCFLPFSDFGVVK